MRISRDRMAEWVPDTQGNRLSRLIPARNYDDLNHQEAQLRVWLPDAAKLALEEVAERAEISMTVYLTEYFATYLYGYHELLRMRETRSGLYEPSLSKYSMMGAGLPEVPPSLGKNIFALKIFIPEKIKQGLQAFATRSEFSLGEFTRGLICAHLFGREYGPMKLVALSADEALASNSWESSNEHETGEAL